MSSFLFLEERLADTSEVNFIKSVISENELDFAPESSHLYLSVLIYGKNRCIFAIAVERFPLGKNKNRGNTLQQAIMGEEVFYHINTDFVLGLLSS